MRYTNSIDANRTDPTRQSKGMLHNIPSGIIDSTVDMPNKTLAQSKQLSRMLLQSRNMGGLAAIMASQDMPHSNLLTATDRHIEKIASKYVERSLMTQSPIDTTLQPSVINTASMHSLDSSV